MLPLFNNVLQIGPSEVRATSGVTLVGHYFWSFNLFSCNSMCKSHNDLASLIGAVGNFVII